MGISFYNINMYEIELKAHVPDRKVVIEKINSFATFLGTTIKDDTYFHFQYNDSDKHLTCRIRHEVYTFPDGKTKIQDVLTYKTKKKKNHNFINNYSYWLIIDGQPVFFSSL